MKTTATMLTVWIVVALGLSATSAVAAPLPGTSELLLAAAGIGQAERPDPRLDDKSKRQMVADLLKQARQAMAANDLETAERAVSQAEAMGVQSTMFQQGDTPKKVRRDLDLKRAVKGAPAKPSQTMSPLFGKSKVPGDDPFAGRPAGRTDAGLAAAARVEPLPPVGSGRAVPSMRYEEPTAPPFGRAISTSPADDVSPLPPALARPFAAGPAPSAPSSGGFEGNELLRSARRALAVGDARRAVGFVQQARAPGNNYSPLGDTPDKVEAAIRKYQDVTVQKNDTEAWRRAYARMMMEQSHALLRTGDTEEAERLVNEAARQQLQFGPMEVKPEDMLAQIAAARRQGNRPSSPPPTAFAPPAATAGDAAPESRQAVLELVRKSREALAAGQLNFAEDLAVRAERMRLPDSAFGPNDDRPGKVLMDIRTARSRNEPSRVIPAGGTSVTLAGGTSDNERTAARAVYDPLNDPTRNVPAANYETQPGRGPRYMEIAQDNVPTPARAPTPRAEEPEQPRESAGFGLLRQGEDALRAHDKEQAYKFYLQANNYMNELDPGSQRLLKERLQMLSTPLAPRGGEGPNRTLADDAAAKQSLLAKQVFTELAHQESAARAMQATDPKGAVKLLEEARKKVEAAGLDTNTRDQLLRRVDRVIAETQKRIDQSRPQLDLAERNDRVRNEIERDQRTKIETQDKVKLMVDEFNRLMDEQRFAEAEVLAKRAAELAPKDPVVSQMLWQAKFVRRFQSNKTLQANKEDGFWAALNAVEESGIPMNDNNPYQHGDARRWQELTRNRARFLVERRRNRSERELEIERKLRTSVSLAFKDAPLGKVIDYLAKIAEVNIVLDPQGLAQEAVTTDTPVTIEVRKEIMLKSALNLVLEPLHLSYVVKDEVLKITSESMRDGQIYTVTYNVADLVIPIPNFVPSPRMGLAGAYHDAMGQVNGGLGTGAGGYGAASTPLAVVASKTGAPSQAMINPAVLAQMPGAAGGGGGGPLGFGPGGLGGGAQADFDTIIDLITSTIHPQSWDAVGGPGTISSFPTNLSIVVSQTQEVHEELVDLLEQLRRLQDLQVTIEVRFITLNDNFFERIGVQFDFNIDDNIDSRPGQAFGKIVGPPPALGQPPLRDFQNVDNGKNVTVGLSGATGDAGPNFSADLDIPYRNNSFGLAIPQFGGFDASAGATIGFAILSDIEAFFFINAAQGDKRSNVLQAPKVTLFNGQQAYVSDTSQTPFVISVVPVVGDFAAAQQPVIVVLSEGTHMTVQAVVSNDRRFVRLTVVPFFSRIGDVRTFQFTGTQTTTADTGADGWVDGLNPNNGRRTNNRSNVTQTNSGTTVQLPTFSFVTVTTTVSVPDGGTVLLGGIKRLKEGRNEFGVPILSKIPYLNRLFKNTAIGRETQSLMMMVTPRIIIQEEEEENLGVPVTSNRPGGDATRMR